MYYSAIGLLAFLILIIENQDILLNRNRAFSLPAWRVYRQFLFSVLFFYVTDALWGMLESMKLPVLLFADTSVYFITMACGVLLWTQYVVTYLEEDSGFGKFFLYSGRFIAGSVTILTLVNVFYPVLFTVDSSCVYEALGVRYAVLAAQILLLLLLSCYSLSSIIRKQKTEAGIGRYRTVGLFGLIMSIFFFIQIWFPYLPLYAIAFLLGTCLLRTFVIGDEKEKYRVELKEAAKIKDLKQSISSLLDNMPALSFSKDAETGIYLACNQAFAEYAHKKDPDGVIGLTDVEIFDSVTASHFMEDDRMAKSMDEPYIFFEDVPDAAGNQRQFQTTKLKFIDGSGKLCILGMCQDVTDTVRIKRENATTKEAYEKARSTGIIYTHIAQALARGYEDLYYVNTENGEYIEYHTDKDTGMLSEARRGEDFFESAARDVENTVYPEDRSIVLDTLDREKLSSTLDRNKTLIITYRLLVDGSPSYVTMKISRMEDDERFIIIGITNVDEEMKQQKTAERIREEHIAYSRLNALAGDFLCVYIVDPETGHYRLFSSSEGFSSFDVPKEGDDFFNTARERFYSVVYDPDLMRVLCMFTKKEILSIIDKDGIFSLTFRMIMDGEPKYVQFKGAIVEDASGEQLIMGINDIDASMKQEEDYAKQLARAQKEATIDSLTGVRNRHSYLDEEEALDRQITKDNNLSFAIVIMDVNDLKKVNDTKGHKAGDRYLKGACKVICDIFKKSPVFRIGGDEFAVIAQGEDYNNLEELMGKVKDHNSEALRSGDVVIACGMSRYEGDESVASVFERADQKMYENKEKLKSGQ